MNKTIYSGILAGFTAITLNAQNIAFEEIIASPSLTNVYDSSVAFADINGDNMQDVLITGFNGSQASSKLYINSSLGEYTLISSPFENVTRGSVAFADIDGDNDLDALITGGTSGLIPKTKLYKNNGSGGFSIVSDAPFQGVLYSSIAFADIDGDDDLDVLIVGESTNFQPITEIYTNDGDGNYSLKTNSPFQGIFGGDQVAFADVDGDNDQDVLIVGITINTELRTRLYSNDGNGNYSLVNGTPFHEVYESAFAFADIDGDNDQDVLITGSDENNGPISELYINDGSGSYSLVADVPFEGVYKSSISFADVDGDNDQDVLITGANEDDNPTSKLYSNDGNGNFSLVADMPFNQVYNSSVAFADVDGDEDQDVLITGNNGGNPSTKLWRNNSCMAVNAATTTSGLSISAVNENASYQWLDCDNDNSPIPGEINQTLEVTANGNYAVEVTENDCKEISDCVSINEIGLSENNIGTPFTIHPNPTKGQFSIAFDFVLSDVEINILDIQGRMVNATKYKNTNNIDLKIDAAAGIYLVKIISSKGQQTIRLVKE